MRGSVRTAMTRFNIDGVMEGNYIWMLFRSAFRPGIGLNKHRKALLRHVSVEHIWTDDL